MIPENYKGREQAFIKHTLLRNYLEKLFMIIGRHQRVICYVDCFAGPWQEDTNTLEDTSIAISLNIINNCKNVLARSGNNVHFRALFIEKKKKSFLKLEKFLSNDKWSNIEIHKMHGDFYELRDSIRSWLDDNSFAFFFIDPTGWKNVIEIETLRPLLNRKNSEFLINFMFDYILRTHTQSTFNKHMKNIFGEVPNTSDLSADEKENKIISLYCNRLKYSNPDDPDIPRLAHVKVLYPTKDRTFYDLVYLTRHPLGIIKFMEVSEKLDIIQNKIRAIAKQNKRVEISGQTELFSANVGTKKRNRLSELSQIKDYWLEHLTTTPQRFGLTALANILEDTGWFISDIQKAFKELESEGIVKNYDSYRKRPKNIVHFTANNNQGELLGKLDQ
ncbi:MAG: three-Cys-motif partner protein TcmP [Tissierellales bacterium]|nr:three-Cys-motif partner protein TcmP [Tissierellales bacterium]